MTMLSGKDDKLAQFVQWLQSEVEKDPDLLSRIWLDRIKNDTPDPHFEFKAAEGWNTKKRAPHE